MPIINGVTTKSIKQVWQSPDGQRTINEVTMDYEGKLFKANTFSNDIASIGWSGDVESYDKPGRNGSQTFVKQAPKENGFSPSTNSYSNGGSNATTGTTRGSYTPRDDSHIKAQWAIGQAMTALNGSLFTEESQFRADHVEAIAHILFAMVDRVKTGDQTETEDQTVEADVVIEDIENESLDLSGIDDILGGTQKVSPTESPWKNS